MSGAVHWILLSVMANAIRIISCLSILSSGQLDLDSTNFFSSSRDVTIGQRQALTSQQNRENKDFKHVKQRKDFESIESIINVYSELLTSSNKPTQQRLRSEHSRSLSNNVSTVTSQTLSNAKLTKNVKPLFFFNERNSLLQKSQTNFKPKTKLKLLQKMLLRFDDSRFSEQESRTFADLLGYPSEQLFSLQKSKKVVTSGNKLSVKSSITGTFCQWFINLAKKLKSSSPTSNRVKRGGNEIPLTWDTLTNRAPAQELNPKLKDELQLMYHDYGRFLRISGEGKIHTVLKANLDVFCIIKAKTVEHKTTQNHNETEIIFKLKGEWTGFYLAMNSDGYLYATTDGSDPNTEFVQIYHSHSHDAYKSIHKSYIAFDENGVPILTRIMSDKPKSTHFLFREVETHSKTLRSQLKGKRPRFHITTTTKRPPTTTTSGVVTSRDATLSTTSSSEVSSSSTRMQATVKSPSKRKNGKSKGNGKKRKRKKKRCKGLKKRKRQRCQREKEEHKRRQRKRKKKDKKRRRNRKHGRHRKSKNKKHKSTETQRTHRKKSNRKRKTRSINLINNNRILEQRTSKTFDFINSSSDLDKYVYVSSSCRKSLMNRLRGKCQTSSSIASSIVT